MRLHGDIRTHGTVLRFECQGMGLALERILQANGYLRDVAGGNGIGQGPPPSDPQVVVQGLQRHAVECDVRYLHRILATVLQINMKRAGQARVVREELPEPLPPFVLDGNWLVRAEPCVVNDQFCGRRDNGGKEEENKGGSFFAVGHTRKNAEFHPTSKEFQVLETPFPAP